MRSRTVSVVCALLVVVSGAIFAQTSRLQPGDVTYLGAFRVPAVDDGTYGTFDYSDAAVAFYPPGNSGNGSLFLNSHPYASKVAEVSIPTPSLSRTVGSLPVASLLQPFTAVKNTRGYIMGMAYIAAENRIYYAGSDDYFDGGCMDLSLSSPTMPAALGSFGPVLSQAATQGPWYLGQGSTVLHPYKTSRYVMEVPKAVADASFGGRTLMSGRHRGWCSTDGPQLYAWSTGSPAANTATPAQTVMQYGTGTQQVTGFAPTNDYQGAAWLTSGASSAVIISGVLDFAPEKAYYGYDDWKLSSQCDGIVPFPCTGTRGWRAGDPHPALLFYDPADLAAVAAGTRAAYAVQPYARLDLLPYALKAYPATMNMNSSEGETFLASFDVSRGRLYLTETRVDGLRPVVHVFQVGSGAAPAPDPTPTPTPTPTPDPAVTYAAVPDTLTAGQSSVLTLTAQTTDMHNIRFGGLTPTVDVVNGVTTATLSVTPTVTTSYPATAIHADGTPWTLSSVTVSVSVAPPPPPTDPCIASPYVIQKSSVRWPSANSGTRSLTFNSSVSWASFAFTWPGTLTVIRASDGCVATVTR